MENWQTFLNLSNSSGDDKDKSMEKLEREMTGLLKRFLQRFPLSSKGDCPACFASSIQQLALPGPSGRQDKGGDTGKGVHKARRNRWR